MNDILIDNYFLPDMAVKFASLMKISVTPKALKMSFKSIPCSTVNLETTQEKGINNFFSGTRMLSTLITKVFFIVGKLC